MLVASVVLTWLLLVVAAAPTLLTAPRWALGSRDEPHEPLRGWLARAQRTSANMNENLPLFAALVLVVHVAGKADASSALGAQIFFFSRLVHAAVYIAGIPYLRTLVWGVSIAGLFMVGYALF
jgi:uncharacterized MAPEG superfamily protein